MIRLLAIALACAPGLARAQFLPTGMESMPGRRVAFSFTAPSAGAFSTLTAGTGQTITCTRASSATYQPTATTVATATTNQCAVDFRGLQVEGGVTNLALRSEAFDNATWAKGNSVVIAPVVTANQAVAPDGNTTADKVDFPAVSTASNYSLVFQNITVTAAVYSWSIWLKAVSGTPTVYLSVTPDGVTYYRQACSPTTSAWSRCKLVTGTLTAANWNPALGVDRRDASQAAQGASSVYAWGAQVELSPFATSYIATAGTSVARAADANSFPEPSNVAMGAGAADFSYSVTAQFEGVFGGSSQQGLFGSNVNFEPYMRSLSANTIDGLSPSGNVASVAYADANKLSSTRYATRSVSGSVSVCAAGTCGSTVARGAGTEPATLYLGTHPGVPAPLFGWISAACISRTATGCAP